MVTSHKFFCKMPPWFVRLFSISVCKSLMFVLQRRSNAVEEEKNTDKERMEMLMIQEREMTEKEKELEDEAR